MALLYKASVYALNLLDPVTTLHGQNGVTDEVRTLKLDKSELKFRLYHFIAAALVKLISSTPKKHAYHNLPT